MSETGRHVDPGGIPWRCDPASDLAAIILRGRADVLLEENAERSQRGKTHVKAHLGYGAIRDCEKMLGSLEAEACVKLFRRLAKYLSERAKKMPGRKIGLEGAIS
jgi:hypothetical protein